MEPTLTGVILVGIALGAMALGVLILWIETRADVDDEGDPPW